MLFLTVAPGSHFPGFRFTKIKSTEKIMGFLQKPAGQVSLIKNCTRVDNIYGEQQYNIRVSGGELTKFNVSQWIVYNFLNSGLIDYGVRPVIQDGSGVFLAGSGGAELRDVMSY